MVGGRRARWGTHQGRLEHGDERLAVGRHRQVFHAAVVTAVGEQGREDLQDGVACAGGRQVGVGGHVARHHLAALLAVIEALRDHDGRPVLVHDRHVAAPRDVLDVFRVEPRLRLREWA